LIKLLLFKFLWLMLILSSDTVSVWKTVFDLRTDITITNIARYFIKPAPWHNIYSLSQFLRLIISFSIFTSLSCQVSSSSYMLFFTFILFCVHFIILYFVAHSLMVCLYSKMLVIHLSSANPLISNGVTILNDSI
jgi:hypothetical protein